MNTKPEALLLVGPTGSGKTPLGACLEERGIAGKRCAHFDFGASLRAVAAGALPGIGAEDRRLVVDVLERGALLENENFGVAARILEAFTEQRGLRANDLLLLNGLPRHAGQADDVDRIVSIRALVELCCSPGAVRQRIRQNSGGDRLGRVDDGEEKIAQKLATYAQRTRPLVERYREAGVPVYAFDVGLDTSPEEILAALEARIAGRLNDPASQ